MYDMIVNVVVMTLASTTTRCVLSTRMRDVTTQRTFVYLIVIYKNVHHALCEYVVSVSVKLLCKG